MINKNLEANLCLSPKAGVGADLCVCPNKPEIVVGAGPRVRPTNLIHVLRHSERSAVGTKSKNLLFLFLCFYLFSVPATLNAETQPRINQSQINRILKSAQENSKKLKHKIPDPKDFKLPPNTEDRIKNIMTSDRLKKEIARQKEEIFQLKETPEQKEEFAQAMQKKGDLYYLFISSSMPMNTIRNYIKDLDRKKEKNVQVVIRGFVGGNMKKTAQFVTDAIIKNPNCTEHPCDSYQVPIQIDPVVFQRVGIQKVPALARITGSKGPIRKESGSFQHKVIYGDAKLSYLLRKLEE